MEDPAELVAVELSDAERELVEAALWEWGGSASGSDKLAQAIGFDSMQGLRRDGHQILLAVRERRPLSRLDWTRLLLATEIVFASDLLGAGVEWQIATGFTDAESIVALRSLQRTLVSVTTRAALG